MPEYVAIGLVAWIAIPGREEPSPRVRGAVRRWRTGRAGAVFGGDFDLIC